MKEDRVLKINLYMFFVFSVIWLVLFLLFEMKFDYTEQLYSRLKYFLFIFSIMYIVYIIIVSIVCAIEEYIEKREYIVKKEYINALISEIKNREY